ncbi:MAG TPA: hypothetical protein ENK28_11675 [Aliiroseovarius sp.]|nr:hypothetical protein [Aliiroseovarius sp.]
MIRAASLIAAFGLTATSAAAEGIQVRTEMGGELAWVEAYSLDGMLGFENQQTLLGNARLIWTGSAGDFSFEAALQLGIASGDKVALTTAMALFLPPTPPSTWANLTAALVTDPTTGVLANVDRLSVTWANENLVLKAGRQAITWGSGLVFHPTDIVAPFAPNAIDTTYKPGVDMLYGQYLFDSGADIQAIAVPRPLVAGGAVDIDASTLALRGQFQLGNFDASLMLAFDRGDTVASLGLSGALGEATWNAEYIGWQLADGSFKPSWLVNISNFSTLGDVNVQYFGEYFHNGFGVASGTPLNALPPSLIKRLSTGQVFLTGRDYLALGAAFQVSADLTLSPNAIVSLNDGSALLGIGLDYALGDNTNIMFNYSQPAGPTGTSFGGLETFGGSGIFVRPANTASLKLVHYF